MGTHQINAEGVHEILSEDWAQDFVGGADEIGEEEEEGDHQTSEAVQDAPHTSSQVRRTGYAENTTDTGQL